MSERVRPACRNAAQAHGPHGFHSHGYATWNECEGWSQAQAGTTALMDVLDGYARDHWMIPVDEGIRLECHPLVPYMLAALTIPGYDEFVGGMATGATASIRPDIPVIVRAGMERGAWRLAHGEEGQHLVAEGRISETAASSAIPAPDG